MEAIRILIDTGQYHRITSTGKSKRQKKEKSFLTNKLFHGGRGAMSLRAKSVNVSTLCQLGTRSGEADKEDKRYYSYIF